MYSLRRRGRKLGSACTSSGVASPAMGRGSSVSVASGIDCDIKLHLLLTENLSSRQGALYRVWAVVSSVKTGHLRVEKVKGGLRRTEIEPLEVGKGEDQKRAKGGSTKTHEMTRK